MNKQRRQQLYQVIDHLDQATAVLETVRDDEQSAFDAMPESLQSGDRCQAMQETIDELEEAVNALESAKETIERVA